MNTGFMLVDGKVHVYEDFHRGHLFGNANFAAFKEFGKFHNLEDVLALQKGVVRKEFVNALPDTKLRDNDAHGNPGAPDAGFTVHNPGGLGNLIKGAYLMCFGVHRESILPKKARSNKRVEGEW
jgi:hypothetical protein